MQGKNIAIFEYLESENPLNIELLYYLIEVLRNAYREHYEHNQHMISLFEQEIRESLFVVVYEENSNANFELNLSCDYFDNLRASTSCNYTDSEIINRRILLAKKINEFCVNYGFTFNDYNHSHYIYS